MKNHVFIGLGGQGGRSLAELQKVMAQRHKEKDALREANVNWAFLSIDSSSDVWNARKDWNYFGEDLSLKDREKLLLSRLKSSGSVSSLAIRPDVAPWLGEKKAIEKYLDGGAQIEGAASVGSFSRIMPIASRAPLPIRWRN